MPKDVLTDKKHQKFLNSIIFDSPLKKWSKNKIVVTIALTKIAGKHNYVMEDQKKENFEASICNSLFCWLFKIRYWL